MFRSGSTYLLPQLTRGEKAIADDVLVKEEISLRASSIKFSWRAWLLNFSGCESGCKYFLQSLVRTASVHSHDISYTDGGVVK